MDSPTGEATYSPQDDKIRVYFAFRQDAETLQPLKAAGFRWAGKQECWHAHWSPAREDAALEATGTDRLMDEPGTLEDRAEARAERFASYAANAAAEREQRLREDRRVSEQLNGQPILVGHHSEKAHRSLLKRAWGNFMKAGEANKRADYWSSRAGDVVRWASYKERPDVRGRRIKTLEAELRKTERMLDSYGIMRGFWLGNPPYVVALEFCNVSTVQPYGSWSKLDAVRDGTDEDRAGVLANVQADSISMAERYIANAERWRAHYKGRIAYERKQLEAQDGDLRRLEPRKRPEAPPLLNYRAPNGIAVRNPYRDEVHTMPQVECTKAQYAAVNKDYKGTRLSADGSHRVRTAMERFLGGKGHGIVLVFLTDSKAHDVPEVQA